jgi:hypothetical protein
MKSLLRKALFALFLAGAAGLLSSCATDDPNDLSTMPWDKRQNWEGAMPSNMNQGR